ncbi:hypothetical protein [Gibbsiella quercinecans]|uniref:hypothetical protein n=1 Tax=Gibbsiella quercinecans TaxID=929813 RepID=UPI00243231EB|nr:hypothetical protein [Gibbsiella quercinecans]
MSEISTLTIKIPLELKDKIKAVALEQQLSLSALVCERLEASFAAPVVHHSEVDNQSTEETPEQPLTPKELKKLRQLLKNSKKK